MDDEFGDETELEIIVCLAQDEAEQFGEHETLSFDGTLRPAKWLNPPKVIHCPQHSIGAHTSECSLG